MKSRWLVIIAILTCSASYVSALELKDVTYDTKGGGKVVFSHNAHLKKKSPKSPNIGCKSCHNDNMKLNTRYTMADMEKGKSCGMCHGKTAFSLSKCTACHKVKDIAFKISETGPVVFSHNKHLKDCITRDPTTNGYRWRKWIRENPAAPATMARRHSASTSAESVIPPAMLSSK